MGKKNILQLFLLAKFLCVHTSDLKRIFLHHTINHKEENLLFKYYYNN